MTTRDPELVAAEEELTAAVDKVRQLTWSDSAERLLTDYVVVFAEQGFDDDGEPHTVTGQLYRNGTIPGYRAVGLLTMAQHHTLHRDAEPAP